MAAGISTVHRHCFFLKVCADALSYAIRERHPEILVFAPLSVYVCCYTANVVTVKTTGITLCYHFHCKDYRFHSVCIFTAETTGITLCLHCPRKNYRFHSVLHM